MMTAVWTEFYLVGVPPRDYKTEDNKTALARIKEQRAALKAAGFPAERFFKYRSDATPQAKAATKAAALAYASKVTRATGVTVTVEEGGFL